MLQLGGGDGTFAILLVVYYYGMEKEKAFYCKTKQQRRN